MPCVSNPAIRNICHSNARSLNNTGFPVRRSASTIIPAQRRLVQEMKTASAASCCSAATAAARIEYGVIRATLASTSSLKDVTLVPLKSSFSSIASIYCITTTLCGVSTDTATPQVIPARLLARLQDWWTQLRDAHTANKFGNTRLTDHGCRRRAGIADDIETRPRRENTNCTSNNFFHRT